MRNWFSISSPTDRTRRLPRWSMSSMVAAAVLDLDQRLDDGEDVLVAQDAQRVVGLEPEAQFIFTRPTGERS